MKVIEIKENNTKFVLHTSFDSRLFIPIGKYVNWKLENNWDDYNELYHAFEYIKKLQTYDDVWFEIHTIEKNEEVKGVLTIVGGKINQLEADYNIDEDKTIFLKYFHIVEKGNGYGSYWLKSIIFPYYFKKGFRKIYVGSSHPKSFDFYKKIGVEIKKFTKKSDNQIYERICKVFAISINEQL